MDKYIDEIQKKTLETDEVVKNTVKLIRSRTEEAGIDYLASIWSELSETEKRIISVEVAGRYKLGAFVTMMNSLSDDLEKVGDK